MIPRKIRLSPEFFLCLSLFMLAIPVKWLLSWIVAAVLHELFHLLALKLCGYQIQRISVGAFGAKIETDAQYGLKSMMCALAGPLAGFVLIIFANKIPMIALCGLFQSLTNLLPIYPLDGGRAIKNLLGCILPDKSLKKTTRCIEFTVWVLLVAFCGYAAMKLHLGVLPFFVVFMLCLRKKYLAFNDACKYNKNIVYR